MHVGIVTSLQAGNKVLCSCPVKEQAVSDGSPCLLLKANENRSSYTPKNNNTKHHECIPAIGQEIRHCRTPNITVFQIVTT